MKPERLRMILAGAVLAGLALSGAWPEVTWAASPTLRVFGAVHTSADPTLHRLDGSLRELSAAATAAGSDLTQLRATNPAVRVRIAAPLTEPEILIDTVADTDASQLAQRLQALGLRETAIHGNSVGGWLPVAALAKAGRVPGLRLARASMPRRRAAVALQGDFVQYSAALRSANSTLTGSGITVGVLSDSFNCYSYYAAHGPAASTVGTVYGYATNGFTATYADDQTSGALPSTVQVVQEATCADYGAPQQTPFTDEGRAMLQTVHVVAPGASLAFRTAVNSEADFANGIVALEQLGARVIADDIGYPDEPFFQDGEIAQAINQVAGDGVAYFSATGNDGRNSWESSSPVFATNSATSSNNVDFAGGGGSLTLPVSIPAVPPGEYVVLVLQWDQPFFTGTNGQSPGSSNQLNLCIDSASPNSDEVANNDNNGTVSGSFSGVTYPACTGANEVGGDPVDILLVGNPANATADTQAQTINISIRLVSGTAPGRVKLLVGDNGLGAVISSSLATNSPTIQGHPMAAGAVAMAAAFFMQTPACGTTPAQLESYSSWGGDPILFDTSGTRLSSAETRSKPDLTAPDGANDTFLGFVLSSRDQTSQVSSCQINFSYPSFFGTSAATPHAAGVAALLFQSDSSATAAQVISAMKSGAVSMGSAQSGGSGAGFLQAQAALAAMPTSTSSSSASSHHGGGAFDGLLLALLGAMLAVTGWRTRSCSARWRAGSAAGPR